MRIQLLHVPDCPLTEQVLTTLRDCVDHTGALAKIEETEGDYPSPTLLVDGIDVVTGQPLHGGTYCRLDVPTHAQIHAALRGGSP